MCAHFYNYFFKKHFFLQLFLILCFSLPACAAEARTFQNSRNQETTLNYSIEEFEYLKNISKNNRLITSEELATITKELEYFISSTKISSIDRTIMPAYIANAQKDFALLSNSINGEPKGDLGPVTLWTLQLFVPDASLPSIRENCFDLFSSLLSAAVVSKYAKRLEEEKKLIKNYAVKNFKDSWHPTSPGYTGLNFGSAKTWFLTSSEELIVDTPFKNRSFWEQQTKEIKDEQSHLDGKKVQKVFKWAGLTSIHAGNFEHYLYDYLEKKNLSVLDQLFVRALYLSALADSNAVAFNSKYTFWVMRPSQRDYGVQPLIPVPNHPSYPSAHSTISATASTIMSSLFPEDVESWNQMAEEAGMSRIWGGSALSYRSLCRKKAWRQCWEDHFKSNTKKKFLIK